MEEFLFEKKKLINYLGKNLYESLKKYQCIVAGGTITSLFTNREINDIDIYFKSPKQLEEFLMGDMEGEWIIAHTDKALLFRYEKIDVQAIYFKYFQSAEEIFDTFDFTVCMGAYDFEKDQFVLHKDFLKHNAQRILKFNQNTAYPIVSSLRVDKYKKKGYSISKAEYIRIMLTILKLDICDYETLKEQMGGMYGENYDKLLQPKEGAPFDLVDIIEKMADMCVEDNYFKKSETAVDIDDWAEFVSKILGKKTKCFKHEDEYYKVFCNDVRICEDYNEKEYELIDKTSLLSFPLTMYKWVRKAGDSYKSYFSPNYTYNLNKYNYPESDRHGLYALTKKAISKHRYIHNKDKALLELRIDSIEDVYSMTSLLDDNCDYKKVFVVREVPKDEYERINIKDESEDDIWKL